MNINVGPVMSGYLQFDVSCADRRLPSYAPAVSDATARKSLKDGVKAAYQCLVNELDPTVVVPEDIDAEVYVVEGPDYTDLDAEILKFKGICGMIDAILPESYTYKRPFTGGYDESQAAMAYLSAETIPLALSLMIANDSCEHEGRKVSAESPKWFKRAWNL